MFFLLKNGFGRRGNRSTKQRLEESFWTHILVHLSSPSFVFQTQKNCFPSGVHMFFFFFFSVASVSCFAVSKVAGFLPRFSAFETRWAGFSLGTSDLLRQNYTKTI